MPMIAKTEETKHTRERERESNNTKILYFVEYLNECIVKALWLSDAKKKK